MLIAILILILIPYIALRETVNIYIVQNPSQSKYESLQAQYANTLVCPCKYSTINYDTFISLEPTYHPICSSDFVSPLFIAQLYATNDTNLHKNDFIAIGRQYFTHVALLCQIAPKLVSLIINSIQQTQLTATNLMRPTALAMQASSLVNYEKLGLQSYMRQIMAQFVSAMAMSYAISAAYNSFTLSISPNGSIYIEPSGFSNCSCILDTDTCHSDAGFYEYDELSDSFTLLSTVMGIRVACTPFHSTFMSTFDCWYSSECYNMVSSSVEKL